MRFVFSLHTHRCMNCYNIILNHDKSEHHYFTFFAYVSKSRNVASYRYFKYYLNQDMNVH